MPDESATKFSDHSDSIYSVAYLPRAPFNTFVSGDCEDKALVWKIVKDDSVEEEKKDPRVKVKTVLHKQLAGHTETVEFLKFNHDGRLLATGGMNNQIRIFNTDDDFALKCTLEDGPSEDMNFLEWHPKGNVLIMGGKDKLIWMFNGQNGQFINCLQGHTSEVTAA